MDDQGVNILETHEYHLKLLCLGVEVEKVFETIARSYIVAAGYGMVPEDAFASMLNNCHQDRSRHPEGRLLHNLETLKSKHYQDIVFKEYPSTIKSSISFRDCDVPLLYEVLCKLEEFPTCKRRYRQDLNCKNIAENHDLVCCSACLMCSKCSDLSMPCQTKSVKAALKFLKAFRDMAAYTNRQQCVEMERGDDTKRFQDTGFFIAPGCRTWNELIIFFNNSMKSLLDNLHLNIFIDDMTYGMIIKNINLVMLQKRGDYWDIYSNSISILKKKNWTLPTLQQERGSSFQIINVDCLKDWFLKNPFYYRNKTNFKALLRDFQKKALAVLMNDGMSLNNKNIKTIGYACGTNENAVIAKYDIHFNDNNSLPECYEDCFSKESLSLQQQMEEVLQQNIKEQLDLNVTVICMSWMFGSIHLTFHIYQSLGATWHDGDKNHIMEILSACNIPLNQFLLIPYTTEITFPSSQDNEPSWPVISFQVSGIDVSQIEEIRTKAQSNVRKLTYEDIEDLGK